MAMRSLRPTPSSTDDLKPWQLTLIDKLNMLHQECFEKRTALTKIIQAFPPLKGEQAVEEIIYAARIAFHLSEEEASKRAKELLQAGPPTFEGARSTCILSFSFEDASLWRGMTDNKKIIRLARSMLTSGYRTDEPINCRTFDLRSADDVLAAQIYFGDGQARGLAARLAFQFLMNAVRTSENSLMGDPEAARIMESLIVIPTVFAKSGEGGYEDNVVSQAVRQNVKASMQLPLNSIEWAAMILRSCQLKLGVSFEQTQMILQCLNRFTGKYDAHVEIKAYDGVEPVAKRARRGRRKSATAEALAMNAPTDASKTNEPDEDRIRIGHRRLTAITNVLSHASPKSFDSFQFHLVWAGDFAVSALSDEALGLPYIWPNSLPPAEAVAEESTLIARDAAASTHRELIAKGATLKPMLYEELLTQQQHEHIVDKICSCFEDSALHLTDRHQWLALRPKPEQWLQARLVIQHWMQTMRACCEKDLPKQDFEELEKAILFGDAMDSQILGVIKRFPKTFHIGMIPDMRTNFAEKGEDDIAQEQVEAEIAKWQAELRLFKGNLAMDQKLIRQTEMGSQALQDILEWNENQHTRSQGMLGKSLVEQFMTRYMPKAVSKSWPDFPGAVALTVQGVHSKDGNPKNPPRFLAIIDFNTPNSRDALKIQEICTAVANLFKNFGVERCALLAHMAAYPKEDSSEDPLEDEVRIMNALKKAGFHAQQRVRMLLAQPPPVEAVLRVGDWHADSRLCYLAPNDLAARGMVKGFQGNEWRMNSELARTTTVTARPMVPNPGDLLHVTSDTSTAADMEAKLRKEEKAAQRGPMVAQAYLETLFAKATVPSNETTNASLSPWIQPGEETWIIDVTAWVGDRAIASLNCIDQSAKYGTIRHMFVDPGYKRLGHGASFSYLRVSNEVATQWMARTRVLHDHVVDARGEVTKVPKHPLDTVPEPSEEAMKQHPGAFEAWKGLSALNLKVCVVRGPKVVIAPEKVAAFQHAPLSISEEIRLLETKHTEFEDILAFMHTPQNPEPEGKTDPREPPPNPEEQPKMDLVTMESLSALEAHAPNLIESQCAGDKHVHMFKDEKRAEVWAVSKNDDHILPKGTIFGGFGSGHVCPRKDERKDCVPWTLAKGDKTMVQLSASEESDSKAKPKVGTFYTIIKPLEKQAAKGSQVLTVTAYGKIEAKGAAGKHGYSFEFPDGNPKHQAQDYILSTNKSGGKATNSGNFFTTLASRDGWEGPLMTMWRLSHDSVRHALHARKPLVAAEENIPLKKGVPVKVLWQKRAGQPKPLEAGAEGAPLPLPAA